MTFCGDPAFVESKPPSDAVHTADVTSSFALTLILSFVGSLFAFVAVLVFSFVLYDSSTRSSLTALRRGVYPWPHIMERIIGVPDLILHSLMAFQFFFYAAGICLGRRAGASLGVMLSVVAAIHILGLLAYF